MSDIAADVFVVIGCVGVMLLFIAMRANSKEQELHRAPRLLILAEIAFGLIWGVTAFLSRSSFPPELRTFAEHQKDRPVGVGSWLGGGGFFVLIVGWVGLWRLWWRARAVYTAGWALGVMSSLFQGPRVYAGPPGAAALLSSLSAGLILGMIYFSELRHYFGRPRVESPVGAV